MTSRAISSNVAGKKSSLNMHRCIAGARCYRNKANDFVYEPQDLPSYVRLGVGNFYKELSDAKAHQIEYIVRPREAYPSGGYGVRQVIK